MTNRVYLDKLNEKQKEFALFDEDKNILVSASAGTGKTTSMICKLVDLIVEKNVSVKDLLVVTFTTAAANEMRQKLYRMLTLVINSEVDVEKKEFLSKELDELTLADIGTIDSICKKLITKYFYEIGIDPKFSIVEKEKKFLLNSAIEKVFNNYIVNNDKEFYRLFESYNSKRQTEDLKNIVERIHTFFGSKVDKDAWIKNVLNLAYDENLDINSCANFLLQSYKEKVCKFENSFNKLKDTANLINIEKSFNYFGNRLNFIAEIKNAKSYVDFANSLKNYEFIAKPRKNDKGDIVELEFWSDLEKCHKGFSDTIKKLTNETLFYSSDVLKLHLKLIRGNIEKLIEVVENVDKTYLGMKQARKSLDFTDLERYTIELLKNDRVKQEIQNSYKYIFVDEYQDVNGVQEYILKSLSNGKNLIMIGDVKQSIYEFRLSQPQNFVEKYNDSVNNRIFDFTDNYRSENNILQFVNFIFDKLITKQTLGLSYENARLVCGGKPTKNKCVELSLIDAKEDAEDDKRVMIDKTIRFQKEADLVAKKISELINRVDNETKQREYEFRDIGVLVRKKGEGVRILYNTLQSANIPVSVEFNNNLFETKEVITLLSFLRVLNNIEDDISIVTLLKSSVYNFNENELIDIRLISDGKYWQNVLNYKGENEEKVKLFLSDIIYYQNYLKTHKISETLDKFIEDKDLITFFKSLPDGVEKESNILEFLSITANEAYAYNINKFLDYVNILSKQSQILKVKANDNCVKIITMHSSKGLDYKACIIFDLASKFNLSSMETNLFISDKLGFGLKYLDLEKRINYSSLPLIACKQNNYKTQIDEEIRLFYVALTRAKKYLYMIGSCPFADIEKFKNLEIYSCRSFLDLLFYSFSDFDLDRISKDSSGFVVNEGEVSELKVNIENPDFEDTSVREEEILLSNIDNNISDKLENYFNYTYPYKLEKNIAVKNSVTGVMQEEMHYENEVDFVKNLNLLNIEKQPNKAMELGNAYHYVMEKVCYKEDNISEILNGLVLSGKITEEIAKKVDIEKIEKATECISKLIKGKIFKEQQFILNIPYNKIVENSDVSDKVLIQGVVDLLVEGENGFILIDFKTNKHFTEQNFIETYSTQLNIYKLAMEKALNIDLKKKFIYSFELGKLIEIV